MEGADNQHDGDGKGKSDSSGRNPELETYFMRQALHVAKDALDIGEVPVGCVLVLRDASIADKEANHDTNIESSAYDSSPSVIVSHGANQVNATRDATRHAEIVAIDRMLTGSRASDQMKLPRRLFANQRMGNCQKRMHPKGEMITIAG